MNIDEQLEHAAITREVADMLRDAREEGRIEGFAQGREAAALEVVASQEIEAKHGSPLSAAILGQVAANIRALKSQEAG